MSDVGREIRRRRQAMGLSGAQLAVRAGVAPSAVSQIETGKRNANSMTLVKLAEGLGVSVGELYPLAPQAPLPFEEPLLSRPEILRWLAETGADWGLLSRKEFRERVAEGASHDPDEESARVEGILGALVDEERQIVSALAREFPREGGLFAKVSAGSDRWRRYNAVLDDKAEIHRRLREEVYGPKFLGLVHYRDALRDEHVAQSGQMLDEALDEALAG
jgi:transcriptional regulator with XRE-family HTH domain